MTPTRKKLISAVILTVVLLGVIVVFGNNVFMPAQAQTPQNPPSPLPSQDQNLPGPVPSNGTPAPTPPPTESSIANVVAWILFYIATFFSWFVALLIQTLVKVATYNHFLDQRVVINGWGIVRDVANNFFIVILLVIAVGTILRVPNYNRQLLPKLLVMAVLINFSKMFTGILIDFSQVLTLWLAAAIQKVGNEGNIILFALGLDKLYRIDVTGIGWTEKVPGLDAATAIRTMLLALILSVVAVVVVAIIIIILIYRIVMLWFLVILSPLAFLLTTFPKGQQYAGMWWSELAKYLIVGPVMLFFLYLSFFSGSVNVGSPSGYNKNPGAIPTAGSPLDTTNNPITAQQAAQQAPNLGLTEMETPVGIIDFLIIVGLMVGSLVAGQKTGVAGASWAGKGVAGLTKWGKKPINFATGLAGGAAAGAAGFAGGQALKGAGGLADRLGVRRVPILGAAAGQAIDKQKLQLASTKYKTEQERITARAGALKVDGMSEPELRKLANSGDKYAKIAATQAMMKQGMFRDDDAANRADNIKLINDTKKMLPPELAATFMDNTKKYNPGLAHDTVYKDENGQFRTDAFVSDVRTGKVKSHEMMQALTKNQVMDLDAALIKGKQGNIGEFLLNNTSDKDLAEMNGNLLDEVRDEIWQKANVNHNTWERKTNAATGKNEITDAGKKMRDKFNKVTNFNNVMQTFDETNDHDVESIRNFVSNNGNDIGKKMKNVSEDFVKSFGDLINPNQFKDQAPAITKKLADSFEAVINKIKETDINTTNQDYYKKVFRNSLKSGASFNESNIAEKDASGALINIKKRSLLEDVMSTVSRDDVEGMKGLENSASQMALAAANLNVNVIKSLSVSQEGSVLASKIASEVRTQAVGKAPTSDEAKRADKLKDI